MSNTGLTFQQDKKEIIVDSIKYNSDENYKNKINERLIQILKR